MRKLALILGFLAFNAAAVDYPRSEQEAFALQHSPEYQTLTVGERMDIEGAFGKSEYVAHNDPTGEPVNVESKSNEPATVVQRNTSATARPDITGSKTSTNSEKAVVLNGQRVVSTDVSVRATPVANNATREPTRVAESKTVRTSNDVVASKVDVNSRRIDSNSTAINANRNAVESNRHAIETNRRDIKRVGASAIAAANLHYDASNSGYAISVGEYRGETAIAGGLQFGVTDHSAATVQVSYDGTGTGASVGFHSSF